jgi:PIN domain nuclease of toxin-antitoxin system
MTASEGTSKKRSGLNLPSPPESLVFFVDRSLGRHVIPDALRASNAQVELHDTHFPEDAQDRVWLAEAGKRGWVVLTKDKRLHAGKRGCGLSFWRWLSSK